MEQEVTRNKSILTGRREAKFVSNQRVFIIPCRGGIQ